MTDILTLDQWIKHEEDFFNKRLGIRRFYSTLDTLQTANVVLIGVNPGGDTFEDHKYAEDEGTAYTSLEQWSSKLQERVTDLFDILGIDLENDVLATNFYPVRSKGFTNLKKNLNPGKTFNDFEKLCIDDMKNILETGEPKKLIITFGSPSRISLNKLLVNKAIYGSLLEEDTHQFYANSKQPLKMFHTKYENVDVISLPHLSCYGVKDSNKERTKDRTTYLQELMKNIDLE